MTAISLPFRFDGYGRVATTSNVYKVYADRVRSLICTHSEERLMLPLYGASVVRSLFDLMDNVPDLIEMEVADAFQQWLPDLTFNGVDLSFEDEQNGEVRLSINYEVPSLASDAQTVDIVVALN